MSNEFGDRPDLYAPDKGYALSGKIMLSAIVILFFVVILIVCLHLYARWYLLNARRRQIRRSRYHRRTHLVFYVDPANPNPMATATRGLDAAVLRSLPVFVYSSKTHPESLDCAVCLSEFEENESGRVLPKCKHSFHIECIDMWFHSHSTCPLCRSPVEPCPDEPENPTHVVVSVTEPGSSSGLCVTCQHEDELVGTSSFEDRGKPREFVNVSIEVPTRNYNEGFENESTGCDSASSQTQTQSSFRSPVSRMLSFKRILSRERRGNSSPSGNTACCGGTFTELDIERGRE
ncbi:RING-H2 finger protein ATL2 [Pistacia vera]|uniref:RING-H2 finger protein ATL2 n=1 Tax=Pistacia vera TaxID=55513 RepID=UPI0012631E4C|nr:RING-H2 finger protein ATL2 [Pistacia vera]